MTYYAAFAEEFKSIGAKSRLALSGQDLRDFATSPFFRTVRGFYQYRVCAAGYMSVVLVVSLVFCIFDMDGSINLYLIYYTRWSLLTVVVYLILAARITRDYALLRGEPLGDTGGGALLLSLARRGGTRVPNYASFAVLEPISSFTGEEEHNSGLDGEVNVQGGGGGEGGGGDGAPLLRSKSLRSMGLLRWTWLLQNMMYPNALFVTLLFWFIVYPGVTFNHLAVDDDLIGGHHIKVDANVTNATSAGDRSYSWNSHKTHYNLWRMAIVTQEHGINFLVMAMDVFLSRAPYRMVAHAHHAAAYALGYVAFSVLYFLCGGLNDSGEPYIYPQLDWATPGPTGAFVVIGFGVMLPVVMWVTWSLYYFGRRMGDAAITRRNRSDSSWPISRSVIELQSTGTTAG